MSYDHPDAAYWQTATFANGDKCTGKPNTENGRRYYPAIDSNGFEYETLEMPVIRINLR